MLPATHPHFHVVLPCRATRPVLCIYVTRLSDEIARRRWRHCTIRLSIRRDIRQSYFRGTAIRAAPPGRFLDAAQGREDIARQQRHYFIYRPSPLPTAPAPPRHRPRQQYIDNRATSLVYNIFDADTLTKMSRFRARERQLRQCHSLHHRPLDIARIDSSIVESQ